MVWTYVGGALISLGYIIPCLSSIKIIGRLFLNPYFSCFLYVCRVCLRRFIFQVKKKNNNSSASILNSNNFTILRGVFYSRNVCVSNRNTIHFVYSFLAYVAFSSCLRREDQFVVAVFFFFTRSTRTCPCHSKWSFFGYFFFLVVKNPYDLRSQIRFWILPKKRTLRLLTGGLSWGRGILSSPLSCRRHMRNEKTLRTRLDILCGHT